MMPEKFMITVDSFGSDLPANWKEIADFLNGLLEEIWDKEGHDDFDDDFKETVEDIWDRYCSDMIPDAPKAEEVDTMRRRLEEMPFDKMFDGEFCHATGYEVCLGDPDNLADWWEEFEDSEGNLHYGR